MHESGFPPPGSPPFESTAPKRAARVASLLRGMIVRGELSEGDTLPPEATLARTLSVSRGTLREALRILEFQSLLELKQGSRKGARVTHPDLAVAAEQTGILLQLRNATLRDIHALRLALEPVAAGLAARNATPEALAKLEGIHQESTASTTSPARSAELAASFHIEVVRASANAAMTVTTELIAEIIARQSRRATSGSSGHLQEDIAGGHKVHARLLSFLHSCDSARAQDLWEKHLCAISAFLAPDAGETVVDLFTE